VKPSHYSRSRAKADLLDLLQQHAPCRTSELYVTLKFCGEYTLSFEQVRALLCDLKDAGKVNSRVGQGLRRACLIWSLTEGANAQPVIL